MERQHEYVLRTVEERGVRFVRLWFTDVLGLLEVGRDHPGRARGRPRGGHDLRRLDDRGLQPDPGVRHARPARRQHVRAACRRRRRRRRRRADVLRHRDVLGRAVRRRPALRAEAQPRAGAREGLHVLRRPRDGVLLLPLRRRRSSRSTTPATSTSPRTTSGRSCASRRCSGSRRWASRSSTRSTRTARSQHEIDLRYTDALTMADNVMTFRLIAKEVAADSGVYATFMPKPIAGAFGSGHAHAPLALRGRRQRVPRPGRRVRAVEGRRSTSSRACSCTPSEICRDHQPVGQLVQAVDPRLRSARVQVLGAQQPVGARPRAALEAGQGRVGRGSSSARPIPRATRTSRSR